MKFKINLATKIYINTRQLKFYTAAAVLILLALLFINIRNIASKTNEIKHLTNEIAVFDDKSKASSKGVTEKEFHALLDRIGFANGIVEKKMYNWLALLDRLELVVPDGIALTSIEPDPKSQGLKLAGVTRSFANLRTFMEHLEDSKFFTEVYLMSQGDTRLNDNTPGISFNLTCKVTK